MIIYKKVALKDIEAVHVSGRRWFERANGNTYHSVTVSILSNNLWSDVGRVSFSYGYDRMFEQTAKTILDEVIIKSPSKPSKHPKLSDPEITRMPYARSVCDALKLAYSENVEDVKRKKDL